MPQTLNNRLRSQARELSKCLKCRATEKTSQRGFLISSYQSLKKDSDRAIAPVAETVCVPAHLALPGSLQLKQLCHLHTQLSLMQSCHRQKKKKKKKKNLVYMYTESLWSCPTLCEPVAVACQASLSVGFSRQEYYSVLFNTGCHTLLEDYISCCSSQQVP